MTTIAIVGGTGHHGRALARRFASAGLAVIVGSRDPQRARAAVAAWPARGSIDVADNVTAVEHSDVIVLAVPFASVDVVLTDLHAHLRGDSVMIDVTVPVTFTGGKMAMAEPAEGSAAEHIRSRLPDRVHLAAAFKTLPAHLLEAAGEPLDCDEFVCADSETARRRAIALVELLPGVRPVDIGPLSGARFIEHATALAIAINRRHKVDAARFRVVGLA
jgi:hypothetical protein